MKIATHKKKIDTLLKKTCCPFQCYTVLPQYSLYAEQNFEWMILQIKKQNILQHNNLKKTASLLEKAITCFINLVEETYDCTPIVIMSKPKIPSC